MAAQPTGRDSAPAGAAGLGDDIAAGLNALRGLGTVDIAPTPKDAVYREDKLVLYRYRPLEEQASQIPGPQRIPLLICYALVNRPYMLDLQEDRSLIRGLLRRGIDVYLIDWGTPDGADRYLELDDYINRYLHHCVSHVAAASGAESVNLLGVCQGGTFSLCYAALHPERIRNLVTMVTPVDFKTNDNLLSKWVQGVDVDALVRVSGNISGELLNYAFLSLMPFRLMSQKYAGIADIARDPVQLRNFLRMEKWIFDSPDQAGEAFRQFITWFYRENRLVADTLCIGATPVHLRNVTMPVLNVYATQDHLVPPAASTVLEERVGTSDYTPYAFNGGHIGIYVSGRAQKDLPAAISDWLKSRV
jgi:polyhydroxyalkanoate synthase subunit PhaC